MRIIGRIVGVETIAKGRAIRELDRLRRIYGPGQWRKKKGMAHVRLPDSSVVFAEIHWYEAHGIGRKQFKIKRLLED